MSAPLNITHRILQLPQKAQAPGLEPRGELEGGMLRQVNGSILNGKKKELK